MIKILQQILLIKDWENSYDSYSRQNNLNSLNSKLIGQQNFENYQNFIETIVEKGPRKSKKRWVSNQRRILHIVVNCISVISKVAVHQFQSQEIRRISRVFSYKDTYSIKYELKKLTSNNQQNRRRWCENEQNLLLDVVQKSSNKNKWNEIAREIFISSAGEYFRQGKHCRERFYKLNSDKSQSSISQLNQSQQYSDEEKSAKFQSRSGVNQTNKKKNQHKVVLNAQNGSIKNLGTQKQLDYNQNCEQQEIKSQPQSHLQNLCQQMNLQQIKFKSKEQSKEHREFKIYDDCQEHDIEEKSKSGFKVSNRRSNPEGTFQESPKNSQTLIVENSGQENQQNLDRVMMCPLITQNINFSQFSSSNMIVNQLWTDPAKIWMLTALQYGYQYFSQQ